MTVRGANYPRAKNDNYPTPPEVVEALRRVVGFGSDVICDPCCGKKYNILEVFRKSNYRVCGDDIIFGYDFLKDPFPISWTDCDVVTNPPYGNRQATTATKFATRALEVTEPWKGMVAMLLPVDFDSGRTRLHLFEHVAFTGKVVLLDRIKWFGGKAGSTNHAWFIWDWKCHRTRWSRLLAHERIYES